MNSTAVLPKKYDIAKLQKEFSNIREAQSKLINTFNDDNSWIKVKTLDDVANKKLKQIAVDNNPDIFSDEIHDVILCDDIIDTTMPNGYKAYIIDSNYNPIMGWYDTVAVVEPPNGNCYLVNVNTYSRITIGKTYS
jgi:hypothetical protein